MVINALGGQKLPVYAAGANVRDWLHVDDHAGAIHLVAEAGAVGARYMIGGGSERANIDVVRAICTILDETVPDQRNGAHERLIAFVEDRAGHDFRYAVDSARIKALGWRPRTGFDEGLRETVRWYCDNRQWWQGEAAKAGVAASA
jgi:dTDP-glucose 4,6-dehydratase